MTELTPEEIAEVERSYEAARQNASAPLFAPIEWFDAAGVQSTTGELESFSSSRRFAAQRLGISTRSSLESAVLMVYLCIIPRAEIDAARGMRWLDGKLVDTESAFRERMEKWADDIGVRFGVDNWQWKELGRIADEIWEREAASDSSPKFPKGTGGRSDPN